MSPKTNLKIAEKENQFKFLRPISDKEIPVRKRHTSQVIHMPFWQELEQVVTYAAKHGTTPFEEAAEIDLDLYQDSMTKLKRPVLAVITHLRGLIKAKKVKNLDVLVRGHRVILVGKSNIA